MNASALREGLMARQPMPRFTALHALEAEIAHLQRGNAAAVSLAKSVARFVERGIPYYSEHDPHYQAWVSKAVAYWEQLSLGARRAA